ncbi:hypothetical protein ACOMHN_046374 [Nucella lapillus]
MIISLRQLQEKCRVQQKPIYSAFIDLTKGLTLQLAFRDMSLHELPIIQHMTVHVTFFILFIISAGLCCLRVNRSYLTPD